jgi:hypothetical protein
MRERAARPHDLLRLRRPRDGDGLRGRSDRVQGVRVLGSRLAAPLRLRGVPIGGCPVRPPEEIAARCDREAEAFEIAAATAPTLASEHAHARIARTFREAAEALRTADREIAALQDERELRREAADAAERAEADRDALLAVARVLRRLRQWDHLDTAGDGLYWKREIDAALAALPEHLRRQVES